MKKTNVLYWIFTGLFSFVMLGSSIPDIMMSPVAIQGFGQIGMPAYLLPFVGVAKFLGVIAILVPGFPRIREWAYAGLMYDLIGATYSIAASGKPAANWMPMFIFIAIGALSYFFYQKRKNRSAASSVQPFYQEKNAVGKIA